MTHPSDQSSLDRADMMLGEQRVRLEAVISSNAPPEVRSLAEHYLAKVVWWQDQPDMSRDLAAGAMGPNEYGPAIDDVCRQAEFFARRARPSRRAA